MRLIAAAEVAFELGQLDIVAPLPSGQGRPAMATYTLPAGDPGVRRSVRSRTDGACPCPDGRRRGRGRHGGLAVPGPSRGRGRCLRHRQHVAQRGDARAARGRSHRARGTRARDLVGETCSWLNPIPGRPLPAAVSGWGPRPGNDDRAALKRHPSSRQLKLGTCAPVLGSCPHEVPLPGSQCGLGKGRTIAWTAHDDEFSSRDRSLAVAEQPAEGRRARCQAQW
jgi:hypothetical protein